MPGEEVVPSVSGAGDEGVPKPEESEAAGADASPIASEGSVYEVRESDREDDVEGAILAAGVGVRRLRGDAFGGEAGRRGWVSGGGGFGVPGVGTPLGTLDPARHPIPDREGIRPDPLCVCVRCVTMERKWKQGKDEAGFFRKGNWWTG
jgi:hypothetical protein